MYNGEEAVLEIRFHELDPVVDFFVVVEATHTHSGLSEQPTLNVLDARFSPFAKKIRHVVVSDMPEGGNPWAGEHWQRNALVRGIPDAADDDLIVVSDVDEIPRAAILERLKPSVEEVSYGFELSLFYFFVDYQNVEGPESSITWSVAARRRALRDISPNELRRTVRAKMVKATIIRDAGWQFSYLMDSESIKKKIQSFAHQELNLPGFVDSIDVVNVVKRKGDLYGREGFKWDLTDQSSLPAWISDNKTKLRSLFAPHSKLESMRDRIQTKTAAVISRILRTKLRRAPVAIIPYVHDHEEQEIREKFRLDSAAGRKIEAILFQDKEKLGPERSFEFCWQQCPDRDVVILHSDMRPLPSDKTNAWWDKLLKYRDCLPDAGMIACNLIYPKKDHRAPKVQYAGGTFINGVIDYHRGRVPKDVLDRVRIVDWVTFGGVFVRRELLEACGSFDRRYRWAYVMDVDYCFEARLRGFLLYQVPVWLSHEESRTTRDALDNDPAAQAAVELNRQAFYDKWRPFAPFLPTRYRISTGNHAT
jgi:hypothetical protein